MKGFSVDVTALRSTTAVGSLPVCAEGKINTADYSAEVRVEGAIECAGNEPFAFSGRITGTVRIPCGRCLTDVNLPYDAEFEFLFAFTEKSANDSDEVFLVSGSTLDLTEVAAGTIRADIPISVLCSDNCKGLCPVCGNNINESSCGCVKELLNPVLNITDFIKDIES